MADRKYYHTCSKCGKEQIFFNSNMQGQKCQICHEGILEVLYSEGCKQ